jgi:hypothetical protein
MARKSAHDSSRSLGDSFTLNLGEEYPVVSGPRLNRLGLDAVVVAPAGLFLLYARNWEGCVAVDARGTWQATLPAGKMVKLLDPRRAVARADAGLRALLESEPAAQHCDIRHLIVCTSANIDLSGARDAAPRCVAAADLADLVTRAEDTALTFLDSEEIKRIESLLAGKVSRNGRRATRPFEFRVLGFWGLPRRAYNARAAATYMEKHPDEALIDLRSGVLERWFADAGEGQLAALAREIALQPEPSARVAIETFLVRGGLAARPKIAVRPRRIDAGHIVLGETARVRVRVEKARGRGYLFGTLETDNQWIQVSPTSFEGDVQAVLTLDSKGLRVTDKAVQANLIVRSNASDAPLAVPIINHVHPDAAPAARYLVRPLAGAAVAGALGGILGWVLGLSGQTVPAWAAAARWLPEMAPAFYALLVGVAWGLLGAWRGSAQKRATPLGHALRRWLVRTGVWLALPVIIVAGWYWVLGEMVPAWHEHTVSALRAELPLVACLAVLPSTLGEVSAARSRKEDAGPERPRWQKSVGRAVGALAVGCALLLGSLLLYRPMDLQSELAVRTQSARSLLQGGPESIQAKLNRWIDQVYLRLYDRRASE